MIDPYFEQRDKPWGSEVVFTPIDLARVGKLIYVNKGAKLSLQYHTEKEETIMLLKGSALLWKGVKYEEGMTDAQMQITKIPMQINSGYTIYSYIIHRLEALEDSVFVEVSSPEKGVTVRLQDDYSRRDEVR
jgi:quercetin dioxygenase-like cupin family protein